ncbi:hypothetical protein EI94DRAFT_925815 [Lactarius quietus]|nr:hypothetical protein EI94DRAFT_925815 [Lactarius quietus]
MSGSHFYAMKFVFVYRLSNVRNVVATQSPYAMTVLLITLLPHDNIPTIALVLTVLHDTRHTTPIDTRVRRVVFSQCSSNMCIKYSTCALSVLVPFLSSIVGAYNRNFACVLNSAWHVSLPQGSPPSGIIRLVPERRLALDRVPPETPSTPARQPDTSGSGLRSSLTSCVTCDAQRCLTCRNFFKRKK